MKIGKKILLLLPVLVLVTIAGAAYLFLKPTDQSQPTEPSGTVSYQTMKEATLPFIYPAMQEKQMAPLFGHREERGLTAARDSLLILPESRELTIEIHEAQAVESLSYEVRSLDMEHLIERTEITDWEKGKETGSAVLPIQNLLESGVQYQLGIHTGLKDGTEAWYYTRIIEADQTHAMELIALAEEFSAKTFHYESAQDLTIYMESSPQADNSSYGLTTLKNSFDLMTWGTTGIAPLSAPRVTLKEMYGDVGVVELAYEAARDNGEMFSVTEHYTLKWTNQRIYMMDYERRVNEWFQGADPRYSGKRILFGISDGEGMEARKSENGRYTAFVYNRELWSYDRDEGRSTRIFSFGGMEQDQTIDLRANEDRHAIDLLHVADNGDVEFVVYGYMNRGIHEGWTGVSYRQFVAEDNEAEEKFFLQSTEPFEELQSDLRQLTFVGEDGFYFYMNGTIYRVDPEHRTHEAVISDLNTDWFAVSADHSRLAWQEGDGLYDADALNFMDLTTGTKSRISNGGKTAYRLLGFIGNDCVYGTGRPDNYIMSNGRPMGLYMNTIEIVDTDMKNAMHYEKGDSLIEGVRMDDSRIHISRTNGAYGSFFSEVVEDTLVCNAEMTEQNQAEIGWYVSDQKGKCYFVQLEKEIPSDQTVKIVESKALHVAEDSVLTLEPTTAKGLHFYAYGRGRYLGEFTRFSDAVKVAYEHMGAVSIGRHEPIWIRANKPGSYVQRNVQNTAGLMEGKLRDFTGESFRTEDGVYLEATGSDISQMLYLVSQNYPVVVYTAPGWYRYVTGFDQGHVRLWDPTTEQTETWTLEEASKRLEALGNDFICWISGN